MKRFFADLHFHSKYSRAVSPKMELDQLAQWGRIKGLDILTAADFTHPLWFQEIKSQLKETRPGVYQLNKGENSAYFILTTEISLIYPEHRIHIIVLAPNLETVEKINQLLLRKGFNLASDGRPILGINARDFISLIKEVDPEIVFIPAHIWTPWFSLYGSRSGFNSIKECFSDFALEIRAVETGLSSDPLMNWQIEELDSRIIVSFSDSHSLKNLGRETTVFHLPENFSYHDLIVALKTPYRQKENNPHVSLTIEFYPEEGKYHYTGHRKCQIRHSPEESQNLGTTCPVCGRPLTVGVLHRVKELSRKEKIKPTVKNLDGVKAFSHPQEIHHPYLSLVPLMEIIAEAEESGIQSQKVQDKYNFAVNQLGGELEILLKTPASKTTSVLGEKISQGIEKNRKGDIFIDPGYDGVYGQVQIWAKGEKEKEKEQISLF